MEERSEIRAPIPFGPALLLIGMVLTTAFLFPGDSPFVGDEALVLQIAQTDNHRPCEFLGIRLPFTPAPVALRGTRGVNYGPLPVWLDQIVLIFTKNPVEMVVIRALLCGGVNAIALLWLTRTMGLSGWFAPLSLLSPWLWVWTRLLGDNCLCIPLTALSVAAYGDFLIHHRRWTLATAIACLVGSTLCHLYTVALVGAVGVHLFFFQREWLKRFRWTLVWTCAGCLVLCLPYLKAMFSSIQPEQIMELAPADGWWFPLMGGHHLTAGFDWLPSSQGQMPWIFGASQGISLLPHLAVWLGMAIVVLHVPDWITRRKMLTVRENLALLALITAISQSLLDGIEQVRHLPHYLNATWIVYVIPAWYAIDILGRYVWKPRLTLGVPIAAYIASMLVVTGMSIAKIHVDAGTVGFDYGTNLANQMEAVARIKQFSSDSPMEMRYRHWTDFPWAKDVLMELLPAPTGPKPTRRLVVRYRNAFAGDARIVVDDFPISN